MPGRPQGQRQIPGWRKADPGGPSKARAAARPGRGRKARPPRVKPRPPAHLRSPKAPRCPPRSGAPCPTPGVPPVLTALRGGAAAEPPRRAAATASASASESGHGHRAVLARAPPARGEDRRRGCDIHPGTGTGTQDTGTPRTGTGTNTHTTPCTGVRSCNPPVHKDPAVSKIAFFSSPKPATTSTLICFPQRKEIPSCHNEC